MPTLNRRANPALPPSKTRRRLLGSLGVSALAATTARASDLLAPLDVAPLSKTPGAPILTHPDGEPSSFEKMSCGEPCHACALKLLQFINSASRVHSFC